MSTIVTRAGKGSPLTHTEVDSNFTNLNTDKLEKANNLSDLASASTARTNLGVAIGTDVQAYDANTAKLNAAQSWSAAQSFNAGVTLGDASGDALTINSSAVSIPNGLNFDSNTFVIDATNNRVGIGNAAPAHTVDIQSASGGTTARLRNTTGNFIDFIETSGSSRTGYIGTTNGTNFVIHNDKAGQMQFDTNNLERMRITDTGNVGIGTSSPNSLLDVAGTISIGGKSTLNTTGANTVNIGGIANNGLQTLNFYTNTTGNIATLRATLDSSGNLGLGVNPSAWAGTAGKVLQINYLTVGQNIGFDVSVLTTNGYATSGSAYNYIGTAAAAQYRFGSGGHIWFTAPSGTAGTAITFTQAMTLDASGNLLVGRTSRLNTEKVSIQQVAGSDGIALTDATNYTSNWNITSSGTTFNSNGPLIFGAGSGFTERMRLDANGNLLLGATTGSGRLSVKVTGAQFDVNTTATAVTLEAIDRTTTSNPIDIGYYARNGNHLWYNGSYSERMRLDSSGNVGIGTSSPTANHRLTLKAPTSNYCQVSLIGGDTTSYVTLGTLNADNTFFISQSGTERLRIGTSGQLGIGGANYGTAGQALVSNGSGSAPSWQTVSGGQYFGTATTKAIAYNSNTISENITVTAGNNGLSAGGITISTGYTVTVETGANWVIV